MDKKSVQRLITSSVVMSGVFISPHVFAAALTLAQRPAGSGSVEPAPNVIISVDDSGSMGSTGIASLKSALKDTFAASNIPDKRLRIAWQSMNGCDAIPSSDSACNGKNILKILDSTHRSNFLTWVDTLSPGGGTPGHKMVRNAGDYLMGPKGINSPWAEVPGTKEGTYLACRKAFHIFMTDGAWNSSAQTTNNHIDADRTTTAYNTIGTTNIDKTQKTLPDGVIYSPTQSYANIYKDDWGGEYTRNGTKSYINTLSDLAFYYWSTDLQTSIANQVKPITKVSTDETITGSNKQSITFTPYWNPKNNPATWQNLITYTIGFNDAADWGSLLTWGGSTFTGSDYNDLATGVKTWPTVLCNSSNQYSSTGTQACDGATGYSAYSSRANRPTELWHMALNGRGKFVPASTSDDLKNAFKDIVSSIIEDTAQPITGYVGSSDNIQGSNASLYASAYNSNGWTGAVSSSTVAAGTGALTDNASWGVTSSNKTATTADKLNARATQYGSRLVLSHNGSTGVSFTYDNLSAAQKASLTTLISTGSTANKKTLGDAIANFVRGDTSNYGKSVQGLAFRTRTSIQGDIINSAIWYTGVPIQGYNQTGYDLFASRYNTRTPMIYVGGNDGMLHGFSAVDGQEKMAYVPQGVIANLPELASSSYSHRYFVDGSAFTGDMDTCLTTGKGVDCWRTMLVGSLGAGGKGYFVLDVTQPGATVSSGYTDNFSATNASSLVVMDNTAGSDTDIGNIFSTPVVSEYSSQISTQIVKMNNGRWAVVMGNGINSTNEQPVLLIQYLDGDKSLKKISAASTGANASNNGLATPRLVDLNADGSPDVIYAGDLRGNMWKFNVASDNPSNWGVAFSNAPLFTAAYTVTSGTTETITLQPITTAPLVRVNQSVGGLMVAFGTGINVTEANRTDTAKQSFYSVLDNTRYKICPTGDSSCTTGKVIIDTQAATPATVAKTNLVVRSFSNTTIAGSGDSTGLTFSSMGTQTTLNYLNSKGWYLDLPDSGERVIRNPSFYTSASNVIELRSDVPASGGNTEGESCEPTSTPAKAWISLLGIEFGLKPTQQLLDTNGDGVYNTSDNGTNRVTTSPQSISFKNSGGKKTITPDGGYNTGKLGNMLSPLNWRQFQ